jgi:RNA polymerase sigma factor (sigma-70 family)
MNDGEPLRFRRYLRRAVLGPAVGGLTDAQLLERFQTNRDEAAFEVLVWRHGPKVLGVCRSVLRHEQDAEDAFQATFLILVRKGGSIGKRQVVGSWLYRVAYRVALRAKVMSDKRAATHVHVGAEAAAPAMSDSPGFDVRPVLDEEINRLPEKYRAPFILCYLDGRTNEEAARELGCPKGTVLSRLAWARERLRARLTRRGLDLSAGLPVAVLVSTAPSAVLVDSTLKAALSGAGKAGLVSGPVAALTQGVLQTMLWTKVKTIAGCVLAVCVMMLGGVLVGQVLSAGPAPGKQADGPQVQAEKSDKTEPPPPADRQPDKKETPAEKTIPFELRDKPWTQVFEWYSEVSGLAYTGTYKPAGTATFIPAKGKSRYTLAEITDILNEMLLSQRFILIRRDVTFTVLPDEPKIDPVLVPRVRLDELAKRGKTELVSVVLPVTAPSAKDLGPDVKKMLGPFGEIVVLEKVNQLILQDTAGNLRQIHETLKAVQDEYARRIKESQKITEAERQKWLDAQKKRDGNKQ